MDRLFGKDANTLVQSYSDIVPGRPTAVEHRHPDDDLRNPYNRERTAPLTKLHAYTIMAGEHQTHDYYMTIGPMFADPVARQLYAEIASIEEQHVTQYESIIDPTETELRCPRSWTETNSPSRPTARWITRGMRSARKSGRGRRSPIRAGRRREVG
jgi:hypothetical protein